MLTTSHEEQQPILNGESDWNAMNALSRHAGHSPEILVLGSPAGLFAPVSSRPHN